MRREDKCKQTNALEWMCFAFYLKFLLTLLCQSIDSNLMRKKNSTMNLLYPYDMMLVVFWFFSFIFNSRGCFISYEKNCCLNSSKMLRIRCFKKVKSLKYFFCLILIRFGPAFIQCNCIGVGCWNILAPLLRLFVQEVERDLHLFNPHDYDGIPSLSPHTCCPVHTGNKVLRAKPTATEVRLSRVSKRYVPSHDVLYCIVLYSTVPCCSMLYCTVFYFAVYLIVFEYT